MSTTTTAKKVTLQQIFTGMSQLKFSGMIFRNNTRNKELSFTLTKPRPLQQTSRGAGRAGTWAVATVDITFDALNCTAKWKYDTDESALYASASGLHKEIAALLGADIVE